MKILAIALSGIGDALMFTPSLAKIKEEIPDAEIDALVMFNGAKDIYQNLPQLSKVIYFDFLHCSKFSSLAFVLKLRNKYDATINVYPSNRKEYNIISRLIGAEKRLTIKYLRKDFSNLGFLNNIRIEEDDSRHNVEENILLCEKLTGKKTNVAKPMQISFQYEDISFAQNYLKEKNISENDIVVGFHPGCATLKNHEKRRWETEKFSELGKRLIKNFGAKILIFGGNDERELKNSVARGIDSSGVVIVETKNLLQSAAVMKRCNLFITNDSSLMHVASALQLKTIAIVGPTNRNYIYPWQTDYEIVSLNLECSPCFYYSPKPLICSRTDVQFKCIKELSVEMVYEKVAAKIKSISG